MKKILFTDLDGTLLRKDKSISRKNRMAIKRLLDAGHYIVIATGRPVKSGYRVAKKLGLTKPGCYMIAFNGAVIYDFAADCVLEERTLPIQYVEYLFNEAKKYGLHVQTYSRTHLLVQKLNRELEYYLERTKMPYRHVDNLFMEMETEPSKVLLVNLDDHEKLIEFQKKHMDWEQGKCNSFFSCNEYLEYCPSNTDKGNGVRFLAKLLNVKIEDTIAVGDEQNDIPMIKAAGIGIAMKNGTEDARKAADYVTKNDNEHDAIAEIIDELILA